MDDSTRAAASGADASACPADGSTPPPGAPHGAGHTSRPTRRVAAALRGLAEAPGHRAGRSADATKGRVAVSAPTDGGTPQLVLKAGGPTTGHRGVVAPHRSVPPQTYSRGPRPARATPPETASPSDVVDHVEPPTGPLAGAAAGAHRLGRRGWDRLRASRLAARLVPEHDAGPLEVDARPTDTVIDARDALAARRWAEASSLAPAAPFEAWAAQGALAALALVDDRQVGALHRSLLPPTVVDRSGTPSPFGAWASALGYDVLHAPAAGGGRADGTSGLADLGHRPGLDVAPGSVDLLTRLHPTNCPPGEVDVVLREASWALSARGIAVVTVALVARGERPTGPAELQAVIARADALGLRLVGDLDGDALSRISRSQQWRRIRAEGENDAAGQRPMHGLVRLAFRSTP